MFLDALKKQLEKNGSPNRPPLWLPKKKPPCPADGIKGFKDFLLGQDIETPLMQSKKKVLILQPEAKRNSNFEITSIPSQNSPRMQRRKSFRIAAE